ncbi:hypothetical protein K445DRAFT_20996 [Daldinia sp. EC12]|nr:hypothetical protein F4774DRAFT_427424 [Daldinia eschscholtzii]OTB16795.1 hypothetical protein K445DRAFT_20996 [Daldinia sp. EC12]
MALKGTPPLPNINNGNWIPMFIILGLTPLAFAAIAIYSSWRYTRARTRDIEMAALPSQQRVLSSREAAVAAASERQGRYSRRIASLMRPRIVITRPLSGVPVSPDVKQYAESTPSNDGLGKKGMIGSISKSSEDFDDVSLRSQPL